MVLRIAQPLHGQHQHVVGYQAVGAQGDLAAVGDTVSLSLNKSLGAPFGAMLAGPKDLIEEALRIRHRLGGGFRPTAMIAAAALAALNSFDHIAEDHRRAQELAAALGTLPGLGVMSVETNILFITVNGNPGDLAAQLDRLDLKVLPYGANRIRLVLHGGITDDDVVRTVEIFASQFGA